MRRSFISTTSINRLISSYNARNAQRERDNLIRQYSNTEKELPIQYELRDVDFDKATRMATVKIISTKKYRTIDRYVTQNYTRYPIYSDWKVKTNIISKKLKLTNKNLESLIFNDDALVRQFAAQIILYLNEPDLIPSWLSKQIIENDCREAIAVYDKQIEKFNEEFQAKIDKNKSDIDFLLNDKKTRFNQLHKQNKKLTRAQKKIDYINIHKPSAFICIITFGFYALLFTKSRRQRLEKSIDQKSKRVNITREEIDKIDSRIGDIKSQEEKDKQELDKAIEELSNHIIELQNDCKEKLQRVQKLETYINAVDFIPLRDFIGYEYEAIKGCYIIHNKERDKYYVGQSKDIMKRIKQHFKGTTPNNIIFAEDYFNSKLPDKADIFEVRIIQLATKDELDRTEKQLIEEYDANTKGYNSTKGNS